MPPSATIKSGFVASQDVRFEIVAQCQMQPPIDHLTPAPTLTNILSSSDLQNLVFDLAVENGVTLF